MIKITVTCDDCGKQLNFSLTQPLCKTSYPCKFNKDAIKKILRSNDWGVSPRGEFCRACRYKHNLKRSSRNEKTI
jgi:hypothetical protein